MLPHPASQSRCQTGRGPQERHRSRRQGARFGAPALQMQMGLAREVLFRVLVRPRPRVRRGHEHAVDQLGVMRSGMAATNFIATVPPLLWLPRCWEPCKSSIPTHIGAQTQASPALRHETLEGGKRPRHARRPQGGARVPLVACGAWRAQPEFGRETQMGIVAPRASGEVPGRRRPPWDAYTHKKSSTTPGRENTRVRSSNQR